MVGCGEADLYQCHRTSRFSFEGVAEAVIELVEVEAPNEADDDGAAIRVKVRGKSSARKQCFLLLEEVLGVIDQVSCYTSFGLKGIYRVDSVVKESHSLSKVLIDMCPGESVEKHILSCHDLRLHSEDIHVYTPMDIVNALDSAGFDATVANPAATEADNKIMENMGDLICFGSEEVRKRDYLLFYRPCIKSLNPRLSELAYSNRSQDHTTKASNSS